MKTILEHVVPRKTGYALVVKKGNHMRVTNIEGTQVVDMAVFNADHPREKLSNAWSRSRYVPKDLSKYVVRDRLLPGDNLMSTKCRPLMTIIEDTAEPKGVHNLYNRMCNRYMYNLFGIDQDGCAENIANAIEPFGGSYEDIPDCMDLFMNCYRDVDNQQWVYLEPITKPGDYIEFRAEMDCLVGMSNCPEDQLSDTNCRRSAPTRVEVFEPE
jgi:uncharacterized protein YcgI (DUF1989 family)